MRDNNNSFLYEKNNVPFLNRFCFANSKSYVDYIAKFNLDNWTVPHILNLFLFYRDRLQLINLLSLNLLSKEEHSNNTI